MQQLSKYRPQKICLLLFLDKCQCQAPEVLREKQNETGRGGEEIFQKRIFHMLHHCNAKGHGVSLIKKEITPELISYEVPAHCHFSSLISQRNTVVLCWRVCGLGFRVQLQLQNHSLMYLPDVHVLSMCVCLDVYVCLCEQFHVCVCLNKREIWNKYFTLILQCDSSAAYLCLCVSARSVEYGRTWRSLCCDSCRQSRCASAWLHRRAEEKKWREKSSNTGHFLQVCVYVWG